MEQAVRIFPSLILAATPLGAQTDAHLYAPGTNLERSELDQLETATRSIDVARYSFTDRELAEELAILAQRGVRIRVYPNRDQFYQELQSGFFAPVPRTGLPPDSSARTTM